MDRKLVSGRTCGSWGALCPSAVSRNKWRNSFQGWLNQNIAGYGPNTDVGDWSTVFIVTIWWLWKWRNAEVFNKKNLGPGTKNKLDQTTMQRDRQGI